jgi:hypothetical protein
VEEAVGRIDWAVQEEAVPGASLGVAVGLGDGAKD